MNNKHFVGKRISSLELYDEIGPITGVALLLDDDNELVAGDESGYMLEVSCPYGTQTMADNILAALQGKTYKGYQAENALLSPTAELGDGLTVNGGYYMLAHRTVTFGPGHMSEIAAPGESTLEHEYQWKNPEQKEFDRKLAQTRSMISKNSEGIQLLVERTDEMGEQYATLDIALDEIALTVAGIDRDVAALEVRADGIEASVQSVQTGLGQTVRLAADGLTITNAAGSKLTIDGGQINAENLNLTGRIAFRDLSQSCQERIGDGLTEDDIYTYIDESLVAAPTIAGAVFMDYDQEYSFYLDKTFNGTDFAMVLEDDFGEIFTVLSHRDDENEASIALRGYTILVFDNNTFYAYGDWDFSNATVTGL